MTVVTGEESHRWTRVAPLAVVALASALALAGCGSTDPTPAPTSKASSVVLTGTSVASFACVQPTELINREPTSVTGVTEILVCPAAFEAAVLPKTLGSNDPQFEPLLEAAAAPDVPAPDRAVCQSINVPRPTLYVRTVTGIFLLKLPSEDCGLSPALVTAINQILGINPT